MNVSNTQLEYLEEANQAVKVRIFGEATRIIYRVVSDAEIAAGEEDLDERWDGIWIKIKRYASHYLSPSDIKMIEKRIAGIKKIDSSLWQVRLAEDHQLAVLLGAGASKPSPSNIPVVAEFLPELWRRARKLDREDIDKLATWCDDNNITNIEDLLTAAQIANFSTKSSGVLSLLYYFLYTRGEFPHRTKAIEERRTLRTSSGPLPSDVAAVALLQETLQTLFGLLTEPMISAEPNAGHQAIANLVSKHRNTTIVTTNCDSCIDQAIQEKGLHCEYLVGQTENATKSVTANLIKMHGSINWFYCDSCQEMDISDLMAIKQSSDKDKPGYPVIGICKHCGGLSRPMIVPPLSLKFLMFPPLAGLWDKAQQAFQKAKVILVVGYSFSEADTHITKMINRAMGADKTKKLIIVDLDRSIARKVTEKLTSHIDSFNIQRVISATNSCELVLPDLCRSFLGERKDNGTTKTGKSSKPKR